MSLQYCGGFFSYIDMNHSWVHMCFPILELSSHLPFHPISLGGLRELALSTLLHALNLHWSSVLHMVIYMFQCYSLISSHPHLLPESKSLFFTSVFFFFFFWCIAYRVINAIFLNSTYTLIYCFDVSLFGLLHSV